MFKNLPKQYRFLLVLGSALAVIQIFVINFLSGQGREVVNLENEITTIREENMKLRDGILKFSSLSYISSKSAELEFVKPDNIIYISSDEAAVSKHLDYQD